LCESGLLFLAVLEWLGLDYESKMWTLPKMSKAEIKNELSDFSESPLSPGCGQEDLNLHTLAGTRT